LRRNPPAEQASGMDEETRLSILDRITSVYRAYGASGHAKRWQSQTPGQRLARAELTDWLVKALAPARAGTILDLGCGEGWLATALDAAGIRPSRYVGVDRLADRIARARDSTGWAEFVVGGADRVPVPDASVDAVAAVTLLSSLTDDRFRAVVAAEIARLVRPGGIVVLYDIRYRSPSNPDVVPIGTEIRRLFPGWRVKASTAMTLLPPIMRSPLGGGPLRYRVLAKVPLLRSHLGAVLIRH
jgi:SAM-dependent methyltransferase